MSAAAIASIRRAEPAVRPARARSVTAEVAEGLRVTFGDPILRAGALSAAAYNLCLERGAGRPGRLRRRRARAHAGGVRPCVQRRRGRRGAGRALLTGRLLRRLGPGRTVVAPAALACTALLPLAATDTAGGALVLLGGALLVRGLGLTGWNVQIETLQQQMVRPDLLARMNAAYLMLSQGAGSLGGLAAARSAARSACDPRSSSP